MTSNADIQRRNGVNHNLKNQIMNHSRVTSTGCLPSQGSQGKVREFILSLEKSGENQEI